MLTLDRDELGELPAVYGDACEGAQQDGLVGDEGA